MPGKVSGGGGHGHGNGNAHGVGKGGGDGNAVNSNGKGHGVEEKRAEEAARRAAEEAARKAAEEAARKAAEEAARRAAEEAARRAAEEAARRAQEATRRAQEAQRNAQEAQARARQATAERTQEASRTKQEASQSTEAQQAQQEAAELQAKATAELEKAQQAQQEAVAKASKLSKADADKLRDVYDGDADAVRKQQEKLLGDQAATAEREAKLEQEQRQPHEEAYVVDADKAFVSALRKEQAELSTADSINVKDVAPEAEGKDGSQTNVQAEAQADLARSSARVRSDEARSIFARRLADAERRRLSGDDNPV